MPALKGSIPWNKGKTKKTSRSLASTARKKKEWWKKNDTTSTRKKLSEWGRKNHKLKRGENHIAWRGGRSVTKKGYVFLYAPDHPFRTRRDKRWEGGYVAEHRLVMEKKLGRYLRPEEDVNHINGIKGDNRIKNLRVVSHFSHYEKHGCPKCGFKFFTR